MGWTTTLAACVGEAAFVLTTASQGHSRVASGGSSTGQASAKARVDASEHLSQPISAGTASPSSTGFARQYSAPWRGLDVILSDAMDG